MTFCSVVFVEKEENLQESIMNVQFFRHRIPFYCIWRCFFFLSSNVIFFFFLHLLLRFITEFPSTGLSPSSSWKIGFIMNCPLPSLCIETTPIQKLGCFSEDQSIIFHMSASGWLEAILSIPLIVGRSTLKSRSIPLHSGALHCTWLSSHVDFRIS